MLSWLFVNQGARLSKVTRRSESHPSAAKTCLSMLAFWLVPLLPDLCHQYQLTS